ncbi:MAG: HAD-IA family hydrolase [Chloroflexi bacterium]|nr:HAD-IA family hydrolase [Chloroflexota bacterium]
MELAAILFDLGDTLMIEETEIRGTEGYGLSADLIDGIGDAVRTLKARGYRLGIVADAHVETVHNILRQHDMDQLFDAFAISEQVGVEKPDARMFKCVLDALKILPQDYARVVMVGNRLDRDVRGANHLGLNSIHFCWNERYPRTDDEPTCTVRSVQELMDMIVRLEDGVVATPEVFI